MIYSINYDLRQPGRNYEKLYEAIKSCGAWWHNLESTWLVDTTLSASQVWDRIRAHVDRNDSVLIIGVTKDYSGWLPKQAWDWIRGRQGLAA